MSRPIVIGANTHISKFDPKFHHVPGEIHENEIRVKDSTQDGHSFIQRGLGRVSLGSRSKLGSKSKVVRSHHREIDFMSHLSRPPFRFRDLLNKPDLKTW